jgi:methylthioxylose transferase
MVGVVTDTAAAARPTTPEMEPRARVSRPELVRVAFMLGAWAVLIAVAYALIERLQSAGTNVKIDAAPLVGTFDLRVTPRVLVAVTVAAVVAIVGPAAARRASFRHLLLGAAAVAAVWAVALAFVDGWQALTRPLEYRPEYLADVAKVGSPGAFLSGFADHIRDYGTHVQGHPPGMLLLLSGLDRIGLGGSGPTAVLCIGGGVAAVPAVLVTVREVAGEAWARRAAPFVALAPTAIWVATTADAFYAGVSAWAIALVVLATGRRGPRADVMALAGGLLFGITAFLSYGLVLLAVVPVIVAWRRRQFRPLVLATAGALAVAFGFLASGFSWVTGLLATNDRYFAGVASRRPYAEFLVNNAAALALVLGPALVVALVRLRDRRLWLLVGGGLLVVGLAMMSGMSKGEVERIWLPFALWLLPAGAALAMSRGRAVSGWLGLQAATAIVLSSVVRLPW